MALRRQSSRAPIQPNRVRRIDRQGFAFIPNRFLRDGFFVSLTRDELALYLLLVLAGNRDGVSFYHYDTLCSILELPAERYLDARNALIGKDLIAYDGTRFQVLSLPVRTVPRPSAPLTILSRPSAPGSLTAPLVGSVAVEGHRDETSGRPLDGAHLGASRFPSGPVPSSPGA